MALLFLRQLWLLPVSPATLPGDRGWPWLHHRRNHLYSGVGGITQHHGYFNVIVTGADTYTLTNLNGVAINSTSYSAFTSGGTGARIYTLPSPYLAADLNTIKFTQDVSKMYICHPNYVPYVLTLISANDWTLTIIPFGATIAAPTGVTAATTLGAGSVNYAYAVTSVDVNGQESGPSTSVTLASKLDIRSTPGTTTISGCQNW
jgi:hypothetical protein